MSETEIAEPPVPETGLILSDQEREWMQGGLPLDLALQKILKNHYGERCSTCDRFVGSHTVKAAKRCIQEKLKEESNANNVEM